jgi:pimeloyl-ACP methyl ester carboxylesterase
MFGHSGTFELNHAPKLAPVAPESYADVAGYYRMSDGDVLEARALGWGEIVVRSLRTGEQRTLLPSGADRFTTGPARYVPTPVEARYTVERDAGGAVIALVRAATDGSTARGEPFALRTEDVTIRSDGVELAATVTRPADERPRTGVAVLGGSSWQTRDDVAFQVRNLAALGFTVIHWDQRGHGDSSGDDTVPFATKAADAVAAAAVLRARDDVGEVGYFGMSRGGWTAPLAVTRDEAAAFVILFVPPASSPAVQEHGSRLARMRAEGCDDATVALADRMLTAAWDFVATGRDDDWERYAALRDDAAARGVPDHVLPPSTRDPEEWRWARLNMLFDPQPVLREIRVPVLAVYGEDDLHVLTREHRPLLEEALAAAGNDDVTVVTVPGVGHGLARPWGRPHHRTTGIGPEGFDVALDWAREHGLVR